MACRPRDASLVVVLKVRVLVRVVAGHRVTCISPGAVDVVDVAGRFRQLVWVEREERVEVGFVVLRLAAWTQR